MDSRSRLFACERKWRLVVRDRLSGGHRSHIFRCTTTDGHEAVVKLTATLVESEGEAAALAAWEASGAAVRLLDVDVENSALLLECVRPGTPLPSGHDTVAIGVAADLLERLHAGRHAGFLFPALGDVYDRFEQRARADAEYEQRVLHKPEPAGVQRLHAARAAAMLLAATTSRTVLLHGDFLDKNLLWNGTNYVAIDPMPHVGDPCADIGFFAAAHPPATGILERADAIASRMGEDRERAVRWAAVWAVGEACETWREDSSDLQACVSSSEFERLLAI